MECTAKKSDYTSIGDKVSGGVKKKKEKHKKTQKGWREDKGGVGHGWGEDMSHKLTSGCGQMGNLKLRLSHTHRH